MDIRSRALQVLCVADPVRKAALARALWDQFRAAEPASVQVDSSPRPDENETIPGRPARPELIHPAKVARRSPFKPEGLAALLHAIAHIEFNAINLALDAAWRYGGMPLGYYRDWLQVAGEEALHFTLLRRQLENMGHAYGDFPAHDNLWAMCEKTKDDIVARMALVPRTMEARGLDATPQIQDKLRRVGSEDALKSVEILDVILRDEVGHVAIGNHWYRWLCEREGLDPVAHYGVLAERYAAPKLYPPFNEEARLRAGFTASEMEALCRAADPSLPGCAPHPRG